MARVARYRLCDMFRVTLQTAVITPSVCIGAETCPESVGEASRFYGAPHVSKRPTPNSQERVVKRLLMGYGFRPNVNRPIDHVVGRFDPNVKCDHNLGHCLFGSRPKWLREAVSTANDNAVVPLHGLDPRSTFLGPLRAPTYYYPERYPSC
ncbi:hypothetical protein PCANC_01969 [Puccinia coronata f. sp. avenae]|uniref:Uncharacterized protein n=1 Tax=Puccinia coronata f. sp. avenae TaxID=200324 RepID=A0A2N5W226_9BASI|nr:hypothetical protein PCASD_06621 [Puccinia coronata f. sp. avenae]PLW56267.1 hypothetical protein PCANC_01969 [Puccinia coronata f. sp. avenae]